MAECSCIILPTDLFTQNMVLAGSLFIGFLERAACCNWSLPLQTSGSPDIAA